jgi:hypothetical protein
VPSSRRATLHHRVILAASDAPTKVILSASPDYS